MDISITILFPREVLVFYFTFAFQVMSLDCRGYLHQFSKQETKLLKPKWLDNDNG